MRNHMAKRANMVPNGTAPEDLAAIRKKFKMIKIKKITLDKIVSRIRMSMINLPSEQKGRKDDILFP